MDKKINLMIVDDEKRLVDNLKKIFTARGFIAIGATSGEQALKILSRLKDIDVILLDIKMPEMDGIEVLKEIKKYSETIQVILYTGNATIQNGIDGLELGAFYFIEKPAPIEELADLIQCACDRRLRKMANK